MTDEPDTQQTTADKVQQAIGAHGIRSWVLRLCSMCDAPLVYRFEGEHVTFDSNCDCVRYRSRPQERSHQNVADTINRQTPDMRARMWRSLLGGEHHES